ncbi:MAG: NAD(P)H-dependent glycerol-3-phosphate dehydrogenase [Candidatus Omnitrophota bacterium]
MQTKKIAVIGDGGWGTTLAMLLVSNGHKVSMWGAFPDYIRQMEKTRQNDKFLPGINLPDSLELTSEIVPVVNGSEVVITAVPSQHMREVMNKLKGLDLKGKLIVSVSKGIEKQSLMRMSEIITDVLGNVKTGVLSGPTISYEVARGLPTTVVAASEDEAAARQIQDLFMSDSFRIYTNTDIIGVELGGSLKNVIAIAAGISDGLGFGVNTKSGLLVRGIVEISRLGTALGAKSDTFYGISGLGDLVTTCVSSHGRNRWFGEEIGKGRASRDILGSTEMVIEGVDTAKSCHELCIKNGIEMPIANEVYSVIFEGKDPLTAVKNLMTRKKKSEDR